MPARTRRRTNRRLTAVLMVLNGFLFAPLGADPAAPTPSPTVTPTPQKAWQVSAGSTAAFNDALAKYTLYYLVQYKGKNLLQNGIAPTQANVGSVPDFVTTNKKGQGDTNDLVFRLEHGNAALTGGIFDAIFTKPLSVPSLRTVRGVLQISGQPTSHSVNYAAGLETRFPSPFLLLNSGRNGGANLVNWLFIGLSAENRNSDSSSTTGNGGTSTTIDGTSQDVGLVTYRTFVGRGFLPVAASADVARYEQRAILQSDILKTTEHPSTNGAPPQFSINNLSAEVARILGKRQAHQSITDQERTEIELLGQDIDLSGLVVADNPGIVEQVKGRLSPNFGIMSTPAWETRIADTVGNFTLPVKNRPTIALWADSAGWYDFSMKATNSHSRFKNIFSGNIQYYFNPAHGGDTFLLLRYENGQERAAPTTYNNFLSLSTGFSF